jgi:hypothetical protein
MQNSTPHLTEVASAYSGKTLTVNLRYSGAHYKVAKETFLLLYFSNSGSIFELVLYLTVVLISSTR